VYVPILPTFRDSQYVQLKDQTAQGILGLFDLKDGTDRLSWKVGKSKIYNT